MTKASYPHLFEGGEIAGMTLKNRLVMSSMCDNMSDRAGGVTDQKVEYFRRMALGGVGWINLGYAYVTPRGRGCTYFQVGIYDDALIPGLQRLTDAVHGEGVRIGCQLAHAGRQTTHHYIDGEPAEAPSPIAEPLLGETPTELSVERIQAIVAEFADAALRAREAGFDLVEFHGAHGYLHHAFVSQVSNHRTDEYGGSIENRLRFSRECVKAVRSAVDDDFIVGYRLSGSEFLEGGITLEDSFATVRMLEKEGADYVHVSGGSYETVHYAVAPMGIGPAHLEPQAVEIKNSTKLPVLSVGRYNSPELAERVLADGHADFIVMGRALLADPDLPRKAQAGRPEDIRPCVACEQGCIDRWFSALDITCVGNPEVARETLQGWGRVQNGGGLSRVLVVGAGPSGLEAARVAAEAGSEVTVWERESELGGQLTLAARPPGSGEWQRLVDWQVTQCEKHGVEFEVGRLATANETREFAADATILATGSRPWMPRQIPGWDRDEVVDPLAVLRGCAVGDRVVVVGGALIGCQTALFLAQQGKKVTVVAHGSSDLFTEGEAEFARDMVGGIVRPLLMERLADSVTLLPKRGVKRIEEGAVVLDSPGVFAPHLGALRIGPVDEQVLEADTIVLGVRRRPNDEEYAALAELRGLMVVGDANEPRTVYEAVAEGAAAGRSVGGDRVYMSMPTSATA